MMKKLIRNLILGEKADSAKFTAWLRKKGVQIGEDVRFYSPSNTMVDVTAPWLLSIGNHVCITHGVVILTHDYAWSVLKSLDGSVLGAQSPVHIGNHVFIGMNAVITRGVTIGDHVIIGAGSVVTKDCQPNSVYAGNPAKRIMSVEEYREKRAAMQFAEAKTLAAEYKKKYGAVPPVEVFAEYFMLFATFEETTAIPAFNRQLHNCGNFDESVAYMAKNPPMFASYEAFLAACEM